MKNLATVLLVISMVFSLSAQKSLNSKKWNFEFGFGVNTMGPVSKMDKLMVEYGFDKTSYSWFSSTNIHHPHYNKVGSSYQISFSHYINQRSQVGLQFNHSFLSEIFGYSETAGFLFVRFSSMSFIPLYTCELDKAWEVQIGPALMINRGKKTSDSLLNEEDYSKISPGLMAGISVKIWNGNIMYGKLSANYLLNAPTKMGPFSASSFDDLTEVSIPESKIGFGHLRISFVFGFHNYQSD